MHLITLSVSSTMSPKGFSFISMTVELWLPQSICQAVIAVVRNGAQHSRCAGFTRSTLGPRHMPL